MSKMSTTFRSVSYGPCSRTAHVLVSHNIHVYHKPVNTLRSMVVHPKDKTPKEHQCGTIHNVRCDIDSSHTYMGVLPSVTTVNPVLLAAATNTVVCSQNEDKNAKVGVWL